MSTLLVSHPAFLNHLTPDGHPERPDRMRAIDHILEDEKFAALLRVQAPLATPETVALCHPRDLVDELIGASPREGLVAIDADTVMSPGSIEAALRAVGAACLAVDEVMTGKAANAFCAMRPPGHHAETARPMGFCLFNSAAIAARHAKRTHGAERVALIDFDVHHGNGSQEIFWADASVMYCSTHQMPLYPGTGARGETGEHDTIINAPLRPGDGGPQFRDAMTNTILPRLKEFHPDLVLISAGFDAHRRDPLANLNFDEEDFAWATQKLMELAHASAGGRVVSFLEGGYDLEGLARSAAAHVDALMHG